MAETTSHCSSFDFYHLLGCLHHRPLWIVLLQIVLHSSRWPRIILCPADICSWSIFVDDISSSFSRSPFFSALLDQSLFDYHHHFRCHQQEDQHSQRSPFHLSAFIEHFPSFSSWSSLPVNLDELSRSFSSDCRCVDWEQRIRPRTSHHAGSSTLLSPPAHLIIHFRLSQLRRQLATSSPHCFLLDLIYTAMDKFLLVHSPIVSLLKWMASNQCSPMDQESSTSTRISTDRSNTHWFASRSKHIQRQTLIYFALSDSEWPWSWDYSSACSRILLVSFSYFVQSIVVVKCNKHPRSIDACSNTNAGIEVLLLKLEYCAGTIFGTLTLPAKLQTRPTLPAMFSNPPDPPRDVSKPARPAPQCFQTRPTRPVYPNAYPNPTRLPAESMMQIILVATAYDSISGPFSNEINF